MTAPTRSRCPESSGLSRSKERHSKSLSSRSTLGGVEQTQRFLEQGSVMGPCGCSEYLSRRRGPRSACHVAIEVREEVADQLAVERRCRARRRARGGRRPCPLAQGVAAGARFPMRGASADPPAAEPRGRRLAGSPRALRRKRAAGCTGEQGDLAGVIQTRDFVHGRRGRFPVRASPRSGPAHRPRDPSPRPPRQRHAGGASCRCRSGPGKTKRSPSSSASRSAFSAAPFSPRRSSPAWAAEAARARAELLQSVSVSARGVGVISIKIPGRNR